MVLGTLVDKQRDSYALKVMRGKRGLLRAARLSSNYNRLVIPRSAATRNLLFSPSARV